MQLLMMVPAYMNRLNKEYFMVRKKIIYFLLTFMLISCDGVTDSNQEQSNNSQGKLYVALQGMGNKVAILNASNLELIEMVDANFSDVGMMEMPHYIAIDDINGYWFVTTMMSKGVGMYSIESNELLDVIILNNSPALFEIDTGSKTLYVSRMPDVSLTGDGMAMGSDSPDIDIINYSENGMSYSLEPYDTGFSSPHAISISENSDIIITASFTYDFLTKINTLSNEIQTVSLDSAINPDPIPNINRLKPLEIVQRNGFAFINCMGGAWNDDFVNGQVQVWNVSDLSKISEYQFGANSNPWHLVHHPFENKVYVALSGYLDGSTGESSLVQLSYNAAGVLTLDWESDSSDLTQLHGIDISENGEYIYVSSRDGRIFKFTSVSGDLLAVKDLSASTAPGGIKVNY